MPQSGYKLFVKEKVVPILQWPTETLSIDFQQDGTARTVSPHTLIVFVPGNPGCVSWYLTTLRELVRRLGPGFAARGLSYAGHSTDESITTVEQMAVDSTRNVQIPWCVDGQTLHKIAYIDHILLENATVQKQDSKHPGSSKNPSFIFLSHSIGCHMVERLCVLRPDILRRTLGIVQMMPFTRMKSFPKEQKVLDVAAANPDMVIRFAGGAMRFIRALPFRFVLKLCGWTFENVQGRKTVAGLLRQPWYAKNFFHLGTEELRDLPSNIDAAVLRSIGKHCPIRILYTKNDQWAPECHLSHVEELIATRVLPDSISTTFNPGLRHDFVSSDRMVAITTDWCYTSIVEILHPRSRM